MAHQPFILSQLVNVGLYGYGILSRLYADTNSTIFELLCYLQFHISCSIRFYNFSLWCIYFDSAVCLFEQTSSDVTVTTDSDDSRRGFTAAAILPLDQGLICVTADQQFLFYAPEEHPPGFVLSKRLVGYNEEILDMRFLGNEEKYLAVATNTEEVSFWIMSEQELFPFIDGLCIFCNGSLSLWNKFPLSQIASHY